MDELKERNWKKFMDRAIAECNSTTLELLEKLPPPVASVMLLQMGKELCLNDEWREITKQLKHSLRERFTQWLMSCLKRLARNVNTSGS